MRAARKYCDVIENSIETQEKPKRVCVGRRQNYFFSGSRNAPDITKRNIVSYKNFVEEISRVFL